MNRHLTFTTPLRVPMAFPLEGFKTSLSGRYEVLRELGAGGMATGYLARHDPGETDGRLHSCPSISEAP